MLARHNCAPTYLSKGPLQNAGKTRMVASTSRDSCGVGAFGCAHSGPGRHRAHLRFEAPQGYRTNARVRRVPGGPDFSPGSRAASGSTALIGVTGRLCRREAAAGTLARCCGGIPGAPDLDAGPDSCARRGDAAESGPAGARSFPDARHAFDRVPACDRVIGETLRLG